MELMVVIAIIGILTAIIVTNLTSSRGKARDGQRVSDIGNLQLALEFYYDRCHEYPDIPDMTVDPSTIVDGCPTNGGTPIVSLGSFIAKLPIPPGNLPSETAYGYFVSASNDSYLLHTPLESTNEVLKDGISEGTRLSQYSFATVSCYDATSHPTDYCVGPK